MKFVSRIIPGTKCRGTLTEGSASQINETQTLQTQCGNVCKLNCPLCEAYEDIPKAKWDLHPKLP